MGAQIAGWGARSGLEVVVYDSAPGQAEAARAECLSHGVEIGAARELGSALAGADWVTEAVFEELDLKRQVLAEVDRLAAAGAVVTSNSSMIVPSRLAEGLGRPDRFLNVHFLPPVGVIPIVEVIPHPGTSDAITEAVMDRLRAGGLEPVLVRKEVPGFIVNNVLGALLGAGFYLLEAGAASAEEVDHVVTRALGHPIGPLRLADYIGLDTALRAARALYEQDGRMAPSPLLERLVGEGKLGRKTGEGFFRYS